MTRRSIYPSIWAYVPKRRDIIVSQLDWRAFKLAVEGPLVLPTSTCLYAELLRQIEGQNVVTVDERGQIVDVARPLPKPRKPRKPAWVRRWEKAGRSVQQQLRQYGKQAQREGRYS